MRFYSYCVQSVVVKWKYDSFEFHEVHKNFALFSLVIILAQPLFYKRCLQNGFGFCRFEVRIEAMVLREEIFPLCAVMSREIDVVRVATKGKHAHMHAHTHSLSQVTRIFELMKSYKCHLIAA